VWTVDLMWGVMAWGGAARAGETRMAIAAWRTRARQVGADL
jgi:hypothetical protein